MFSAAALRNVFRSTSWILDVLAHREVGAIDLQHEAGLGDRLVFVPHRVRDGVEIGLLARIVIVAEEHRHHAGRRRAHEAAARLHGADRGLQIVDVRDRGLRVAHADRRVAGRRLAARAAGIAEHLLAQLREILEVLIDEGVAGAAEAREAILHIGRVARLRELAVVDEIDRRRRPACCTISATAERTRAPSASRIDRHALLLGVHHADEIVRPRQAAGMGGEKALGAADHDFALSPSASNCSSSLSAPSTFALISADASSPSRSSSAPTRRA